MRVATNPDTSEEKGKTPLNSGEEGNPNPDDSGSGTGTEKPGTQAGESSTGEEKKFSQTDVDSVAARVRDEEKRKHERELQKVKDEEARRKAEEEGKFKDLYEAERQKAAELPTLTDKVNRYESQINAQIDAQIQKWPSEVKEGDPGKEDVEARLQWLDRNRNLATRLMTAAPPVTEHGKKPRSSGGATDAVQAVTQSYKGPPKRS